MGLYLMGSTRCAIWGLVCDLLAISIYGISRVGLKLYLLRFYERRARQVAEEEISTFEQSSLEEYQKSIQARWAMTWDTVARCLFFGTLASVVLGLVIASLINLILMW
jgi:hypothetical protein